ncbi:hypothetical protein CEXT_171101 [Caerostris extrusa]|uniref:TIR domain-containing protein n=1 Tax=Caerostris extrusa TaxID=172846 RepID=A0AAV4XSZ9_CAEEX|nr:hypothetical protein CEXT_171101 [Caerostris extrusa]
MPTSPSADRMRKKSAVFAEKALWSLTDLDLCRKHRPLCHDRCLGSLLSLNGGRWKNRLDEVRDAREGVALLPRGDLGEREGHRPGQGVRRLHLLQPQDQDLVIPELIEQTEARDPKVKLFIHYKHFLPGELIQLNILRAIGVSKRTVLVLSSTYSYTGTRAENEMHGDS